MGMLWRACGAQVGAVEAAMPGAVEAAATNKAAAMAAASPPPPSPPPCQVSAGWLMDGHVKTSAVPRACIHDIHEHIQNKKVNPLLPLLLVCAV